MASRVQTVGAIAGAAVAVGVLGAAVLLVLGSQLGVWIVAVGVPLVIVGGVALYVQGVVNRDSTGTTEFLTDRARNTAVEFREAVTSYTRTREEYPRWNTGELDARLSGLADDFEAAGVSVSVTDGTFTVNDPGNPRDFDELERAVSSFVTERDESFREFVRAEIHTANASLDRLAPETLAADETTVADPTDVGDDAGIDAAERVLQRARDAAREQVDAASERVEETITEYDRDPSVIRQQLESATASAADADFEEAVAQIERATSVLETEVGGEFSANQEAIRAMIDTVRDARVDAFVSRDRLATVDEIDESVATVGSAMDTDRLDELDRRLRETCLGMIEELQADLDAAIDTIGDADIPVGFYTVPPAAGTDYRSQLRGTDELSTFRREWLQAVGELTDALDEAQQKATVAESYGTIADRIESALQTSGRVTGDDLPVREPTQFMQLYAADASEVSYDPSVPVLSAPGGGETYEVTVQASLASHDGTEHRFQITLTGEEFEETRHQREYIAAQAGFQNVPYGEYEVRVTLDDEAYPTIEQSVRVTANRTVDVELSKLSLVDRVCGSDRAAIESQLSTVSDELTTQYRRGEEYLTASDDLPVTQEYAPCLLALWADEEGYDARLDGGEVLVYDHDGVTARVEQAVRDRVLRDDERIRIETIRSNYLSVPVSDELVTEIIQSSGLAVSVEDGEVAPA